MGPGLVRVVQRNRTKKRERERERERESDCRSREELQFESKGGLLAEFLLPGRPVFFY